MLKRTFCATCLGVDAITVTVEVDVSDGVRRGRGAGRYNPEICLVQKFNYGMYSITLD